MKRFNRRRARKLAVQAIYQWQCTKHSIDQIENQYIQEANPKKVDIAYFSELISNVINNIDIIDSKIIYVLDRDINDLNYIECAILRLATSEFIYKKDVPYKVVINEALELAKIFGSKEGYKYVNGVLDKIAKKLNEKEVD